MCDEISFFVKCHRLIIFHVICIKSPINQMKPYLECNQKSMNCSSTFILWGQLFHKYENLKWGIVAWQYGWNMAFPIPIALIFLQYHYEIFCNSSRCQIPLSKISIKTLYDDVALWQTCNIVLLKGATLILASPSPLYFVLCCPPSLHHS